VISRAVHAVGLPEGRLAAGLEAIQARWPGLDLGSYPFYRIAGDGVAIVAKGNDPAAAEAAIAEVAALMTALGAPPRAGEPPA
jgi:molybdopterin-biosynthesis enzyme MoeA-like protein